MDQEVGLQSVHHSQMEIHFTVNSQFNFQHPLVCLLRTQYLCNSVVLFVQDEDCG